MIDLDKWLEIWATLSRNKLRTFLTALGVGWGIFMLVCAVAFARGLKTGVTKQMGGFATNSVYVWGGRTTMPYRGMQPGRWTKFTDAETEALSRVDGIEVLAPRIRVGGWPNNLNVTRANETGNFAVMGDHPQFNKIMNMKMLAGRWIDPYDIRDRRKVAVIGNQVRDVLFKPGEQPIGDHIAVGGVWFQVVGVFEPTGEGDEGDRQSQTIMVPFTTAQQAFNLVNEVGFFALTVDPDLPAELVEDRIRTALAERLKIHPDDKEAFGSFNAAKEFGKIQRIFLGIEFITWFIGIMTLLAGVLGVSNILLISVKERTKEIGIRKALGAPPGAVVVTILQESIVLTTVAGYFGLVAGVGAVELIGMVIPPDGPMARPEVDFGVAIVSVLILVVSGALAGLIPAMHAARIPPVVALRTEL
ncbi:MAG TPA: ABC transporter permease [Kofleriaceae bacterium]|nr:ABC transporter permease [Kofleriaceae bacterium]